MKHVLLAASLILGGALSSPTGAGPVEIVPKTLRGAKQPQVTVSSDGNVAVVFGRETNVFFVRSLDQGKGFAAPVLVGSLPKLALGARRGPRIALSRGEFIVSAISHADGNLVTWRTPDEGKTWAPAVRVNSVAGSAREGLHAMAADESGNIYLAWLDLRNGKTQLWMASSADGGKSWGENRLVYTSPSGSICECCHPSLAVDGQGRLWAMWRNSIDGARDMFLSSSADGGRTFTEAGKLGTISWTLKACPMDGGQIVVSDGELPQTVWRRDKSIVRTDVTGDKILSLRGIQPVGAIAGGTGYWLWQDGRELFLKRGAAGAAVLDKGGAFASIAVGKGRIRPYVVWESSVEGERSIVGEELP